MEFALDDDQLELQRSVREFLAERYPMDQVARIADGDGFDRESWTQIADLGWTTISIPRERGGLGLGFLEEALVLEQLGWGLFPGPYLSSVTLGLPALAAAPDLEEDIATGRWTATLAWAGADGEYLDRDLAIVAERTGERWELSGTAWFVPDAHAADLLVVAASAPDEPGLWAVRSEDGGVAIERLPTVDTTRELAAIRLDRAQGRRLAASREPEEALRLLRNRALAGLAAEAVGVASRALELSLDHARSREQFGRPIGVYQGVSHSLADAFVEVESARSLAYWAAWAVGTEADEAGEAAVAAKAYAAEAAVRTCERAIQVHGGMGFTWEHPLHRFYRRALWIAAFMGWPATHRATLAASLLD
jgi:alkylation response protein AidB-like acyl-CoA dehydrogenase